MQCNAMTERYFVFNNRRMRVRGNVNDASVLNVGAPPDADKIHIAAQNRAEPNAGIFADFDIADNRRIFGNKNAFVNFRFITLKLFYHLECKKNEFKKFTSLLYKSRCFILIFDTVSSTAFIP